LTSFYENPAVIGSSSDCPRTEAAFGLALDVRAKRILDLGCGDGEGSARLAKITGANVVCADVSELAVAKCRDRGLEAHHVVLGESPLPFDTASFDLVYMTEVLEHLVDPDKAVDEVVRVLNPGGYLILSTPNLACLPNRFLVGLGIQPLFSEVSTTRVFGRRFSVLGQGSQPVGHLRLYTKLALTEFLHAHGFSSVRVRGAAYHAQGLLSAVERVIALAPSLAMILVVSARVEPAGHVK